MKLLIFITLLSSATIYANTCENFGEKAYFACEETGMFQSYCQKNVGSNHADENAVDVCLSVPNAPDVLKNNCIVATVNKHYTLDEILECSEKQSFKRIDCITNSGTPFIPNQVLINSGEEAIAACEDTSGFAKYCKRSVGSRHSDLGALSVCLSVPNVPDNLKFACIKGTLDKTFTADELANCMEKQSFRRVDCITNSGSALITNNCH